jgi:hypothetical protein
MGTRPQEEATRASATAVTPIQPIALAHGYLVHTSRIVEYVHFTSVTAGYVVGQVTYAEDAYGQVDVYHGILYGKRDSNGLSVRIDWDGGGDGESLFIEVQPGGLAWSDNLGSYTGRVASSSDYDAALAQLEAQASNE